MRVFAFTALSGLALVAACAQGSLGPSGGGGDAGSTVSGEGAAAGHGGGGASGSSSSSGPNGGGGSSGSVGGGGSAATAGGGGAPGVGGAGGTGGTGGAGGTGGTGVGPGGAGGTGATGVGGSGGAGGGPGACDANHLLIAELTTRGVDGGSDEFVELFNPTDNAVVLNNTWKIQYLAYGASTSTYTTAWQGTGETIAAHGHYLITGLAYAGATSSDGTFLPSTGIKDAASVWLTQATTKVDVVCFTFSSNQHFSSPKYTCEGDPADNAPHNDGGSVASNVDQSIRRRSAGGVDKCMDTGDSATDFVKQAPSTPQNSQ